MPDPSAPRTFSFNLATEPWLPCLMTNGTRAELSLLEVLRRAHEVSDLVLDTPTQFPPVLRMLLATLYQAIDAPWDGEQWGELFDAGDFVTCVDSLGAAPAEKIGEYLSGPEAAERFNLFHPVRPFMQAAGLNTGSGAKTCAILMPHIASGNNVPLFSGDRDSHPRSLIPAEAARWLLHAHAWDTAAIKPGAEGDPKASKGKTTGNPTGPLGQLGVLIPCGDTLWKTLMLNLLDLGEPLSPDGDEPSWERDEPLTHAWDDQVKATGLMDLYTWPSRRIRLIPEEDDGGRVAVRTVMVCAGDRLNPDSVENREPHTSFSRSPAQEKKTGHVPTYRPRAHRVDQRLWRGLGTILARERTVYASGGSPDGPWYRKAKVLEKLGSGVRLSRLRDHTVRLQAFGIAYGNQAAVIDDVYTDELPLPVALLRIDDNELEEPALKAVAAADRAASCLGDLASNIDRAAGCRDEKLLRAVSSAARTRLYFYLDHDFPLWIVQLPHQPVNQALAAWRDGVRRYANRISNSIIDAAPPVAYEGRMVKDSSQGGSQQTWMDAAAAELRFRAGLKRALDIVEVPSDGNEEGEAA